MVVTRYKPIVECGVQAAFQDFWPFIDWWVAISILNFYFRPGHGMQNSCYCGHWYYLFCLTQVLKSTLLGMNTVLATSSYSFQMGTTYALVHSMVRILIIFGCTAHNHWSTYYGVDCSWSHCQAKMARVHTTLKFPVPWGNLAVPPASKEAESPTTLFLFCSVRGERVEST